MPLPPILHLDDARSWRGGEQQVLYLHRGLLARGHDSTVACRRDGALHERLREERLPHVAFPLAGAHDMPSAWQLGRLLRQRRGLLHAHTSHAHDLGLWAHRLSGGFPLVVSRRVDFPVGRSWLGQRKYRSRRVRLYLAISSATEAELRKAGVESERIRRVPSGVDLRRFENVGIEEGLRAELGLREDELLFGNVAALAPHKDQRTLLEAFALYREAGGRGRLVVLGEGELRAALERRRGELGLQDVVHLVGFRERVLEHMRAFDVFVLSSELEGLGTATLDAMALGLPVVATRTGGIPDAVQHEQNGLLVPPHDPPALARALRRMGEDPTLRERLGRRGRAEIGRFDVERTVEQTIDAYGSLG